MGTLVLMGRWWRGFGRAAFPPRGTEGASTLPQQHCTTQHLGPYSKAKIKAECYLSSALQWSFPSCFSALFWSRLIGGRGGWGESLHLVYPVLQHVIQYCRSSK